MPGCSIAELLVFTYMFEEKLKDRKQNSITEMVTSCVRPRERPLPGVFRRLFFSKTKINKAY